MRSKQSNDDPQLSSEGWSWKDEAFSSYNEEKITCCSTSSKESHRNSRAEVYAREEETSISGIALVKHQFSSVLSCVEPLPLIGHVSYFPESTTEHPDTLCEGSSMCKVIKDVHISAGLMEEFMELAKSNTKENLETCGVLGAFLKNQTFYATTLVIPKQETTSYSCQAFNEEEIHAIQDERSLLPVGWIHTHPSQTCFLSSVDLHTQFSYQVMMPEAIAIVMAPTDPTRSCGIFRLTDPGGIAVLKECPEGVGFHTHPEASADGTPIYEDCSNVYIDPNLRFEIIDLRSAPAS